MNEDEAPRRMNSLEDRNAIVESALDAAIRRGDFDDLPGLGKPLTGLHNSEDPDWWIKQKMDREELNGVAPAAFQLRKENAVLEDTLDAFTTETQVREYLAGFNDRVRAAIMDLREGPPVFTPPRKVEDEVIAWRRRRAATREQTTNPTPTPNDGQRESREQPRRWWQRKRRQSS
ncbi:DUF1992 domain-containing protein [Brevibacterium marinum]|uniref:DnaJ homologue subfamily C member 28 conserved domain-containing protein n=1 Tax=Brevibacterium marinum TaxID=418643 RepID=A0A846RVS1_9MICO|nr:DUF1992 domain-containing protein [Brevibacterium marinum]NJC58284.1 hypothetical protein [Brevibacterium marinum]